MSILTIATLMSANSFMVYANSFNNSNQIGEEMIKKSNTINAIQYEDNTMIIDRTPVSEKSTMAVPQFNIYQFNNRLLGKSSTAPNYKSSIKCDRDGFGAYENPFAVAKSTSSKKIDYIYAKARAYDSDGVLMNSDSQEEENTSYVSATALYEKDSMIFDSDSWALGNHTYRNKGYKDVVHETKDNW